MSAESAAPAPQDAALGGDDGGLLCDESTLLDASELEAMLKAVPGVTAVSTKPTGDSRKRKPNNFGVTYKLRLPSSGAPVTRRSACTEPDAADPRPTLVHALLAAIHNACEELGLQAPDGLAGPAPPSPAELEWLQGWCDVHEAPDTITHEMADAALRARRAELAGEASSGATSGGRTAGAILQKTQVLRAQVSRASRSREPHSPAPHSRVRHSRVTPPRHAGRTAASPRNLDPVTVALAQWPKPSL